MSAATTTMIREPDGTYVIVGRPALGSAPHRPRVSIQVGRIVGKSHAVGITYLTATDARTIAAAILSAADEADRLEANDE